MGAELSHSPYSILIFQAGRLTFANPQAEQISGCSRNELYATSLREALARFFPFDSDRLSEACEAALSAQLIEPCLNCRFAGALGEQSWMDVMVTPVRYAGQEALQMVWMQARQQMPEAAQQELERQRRQEAEVMRDMMAALAGAGDLKQTLETILVNLHNLIQYDRASLFLVNENDQLVTAGRESGAQVGGAFPADNPLVEQMRQSHRPLVVNDAQADPRFDGWPDIREVRGWIGAPLQAGEEMIGFLSLGSLEEGAYSQEEAGRLGFLAEQVGRVLEKAWLREQSQRRTEELEVISNLSFALGQAESGENTIDNIVRQIAQFFEAQSGVFLSPDRSGDGLTVKASLEEEAPIPIIPADGNSVWRSFISGEALVIPDLRAYLLKQKDEHLRELFPQAGSCILAPLRWAGGTFGLLGFGFERPRKVSAANLHLFNTVAEIAGVSLRRAVILEGLEKQIEIRTQHLSTLYEINATASEPLELAALLKRVLQITLDSLTSQAGTIHLLDKENQLIRLAVQVGLEAELAEDLDNLTANHPFWARLMSSSNPLVAPDLSAEAEVPEEFAGLTRSGPWAFIGAPIRAKGKVLGFLSLFDRSILDYTIEEITLFTTIADQIGGLVERARLMKQAEAAAVVQERQRLARELHDSVTQLLYGQVLFAGAGLKVLRLGDEELAEQHLARIDQAALQALKEMRLLVYQLRPSEYLEEGLVGALRRRLEAVEQRTGINARLAVQGEISLDESQEMALYRIAEEALNNTLKHAQAKTVLISLRAANSRVILEIEDDGAGFDPSSSEKAGGMGLENMRERSKALGGEFQILSQPERGTKIILSIEVSP